MKAKILCALSVPIIIWFDINHAIFIALGFYTEHFFTEETILWNSVTLSPFTRTSSGCLDFSFSSHLYLITLQKLKNPLIEYTIS